jgi:hypothetical protein
MADLGVSWNRRCRERYFRHEQFVLDSSQGQSRNRRAEARINKGSS